MAKIRNDGEAPFKAVATLTQQDGSITAHVMCQTCGEIQGSEACTSNHYISGPYDLQAPLQFAAGEVIVTDEQGSSVGLASGVETESATDPEQPPNRALQDDWCDMTEAPRNRPIFLTSDPATDHGLLCQWRTTRKKNNPPVRGWSPRSFWAAVLTKREIEFVPYCWREAMAQGAAALVAAKEVA